MKKMLVTGLLAICVIAVVQQEASAWISSRFGFGLNWEWQSGGNSVAWGLWRNGQPGEPTPLFAQYQQYPPSPAHYPQHAGSSGYYPQYAPSSGYYPQHAPSPAYYLQHAPSPAYYPPTPQPHLFDAPPLHPTYTQPMRYAPPYQVTTYPRPAYYYYGR